MRVPHVSLHPPRPTVNLLDPRSTLECSAGIQSALHFIPIIQPVSMFLPLISSLKVQCWQIIKRRTTPPPLGPV